MGNDTLEAQSITTCAANIGDQREAAGSDFTALPGSTDIIIIPAYLTVFTDVPEERCVLLLTSLSMLLLGEQDKMRNCWATCVGPGLYSGPSIMSHFHHSSR